MRVLRPPVGQEGVCCSRGPYSANALLALRELQHFQAARGRDGLEVVDRLDLGAFIHQGCKAPHCAVAGLRWFVKQAELAWRVPVAGPTGKGEPSRDDRQAVLAEPPTMVQLEKAIEA